LEALAGARFRLIMPGGARMARQPDTGKVQRVRTMLQEEAAMTPMWASPSLLILRAARFAPGPHKRDTGGNSSASQEKINFAAKSFRWHAGIVGEYAAAAQRPGLPSLVSRTPASNHL